MSKEISKLIISNQKELHPKLETTVRKHLTKAWKKPKPKLNSEPIELLERHLALPYKGLVIDSFCGTGESTKILSKEHPEFLVLGIDKSSYRLSKHKKSASKNYLLINERCENIWEYLLKRGLRVDFHYIFYPNPWPKSKHLKRRIYGHPSFPTLIRLGGIIEVRSNWSCYIEELGISFLIAGVYGAVSSVTGNTPVSPFERKFQDSGHDLWKYKGKL